MSDESIQPRLHGKRGAKLMATVTADPNVSAQVPSIDPTTLPATFDATKGRGLYPMLDNDSLGNCGEVALAVAMMNQAMTGLNDRNQPVYVDGFVEPDAPTVDGWYHEIAAIEGEPFTEGEGPGTSPYALASYALSKGLAVAVGVLGNVAPDVIAQAIIDTNGGAIVTWALDDDCFQEFDAKQCWGTMSVKPDAKEGHATDGCGYGADFTPIVDTWTRLECTTLPFTQNCQDGLVLIFTQAWVEQGGDLDAMVAKWGLTTAIPPTPAIGGDIADAEWLKAAEAKIREEIARVPEHIEGFVHALHGIADAAMKREAVVIIEQLLADAVKIYAKGL